MSITTQKSIALPVAVLAGVFLTAIVGITIEDYFVAQRKFAVDANRIKMLEESMTTDPSQGAALQKAYERLTEQSLQRDATRKMRTWFIIAAAVSFLVCSKWLLSIQGIASPRRVTIQVRKADDPAFAASPENPNGTPTAVEESINIPEINLAFVDEMVSRYGRTREMAIPILQAIQQHYRYLPDEALKRVCEATEISPSQIAGVSSFYAQFRRSPVGKHIIKVCHGTACHVSGATQITDEIRRYLRIAPEADTDARRLFTVDPVACLGCCSLAPVIMIDDETAGGLTPMRAREAVQVAARESNG